MNTINNFYRNNESSVVYRYLDLLAERTVALEQRIELDEIKKLRKENQQLREQLAVQGSISLEQLLVFLPIIYKGFWNVVRPDELATLAGSLSVPTIPSPYPEPTPATVAAMKKKFMQLPDVELARLIAFCHKLPYSLTVRTEMRALLENDK